MASYKLVKISKSDRPKKKMMAIFLNNKTRRMITTHFGAAGMDDYTITKDKEQRERYRERHKKDIKGNPTRAGYLSYYILWGDSTSKSKNIDDFKNRFFS